MDRVGEILEVPGGTGFQKNKQFCVTINVLHANNENERESTESGDMGKETRKYIAHKREDGFEQTLLEHLEGTADLAAHFAMDFDSADQGKLVGMAHDIGKYSREFQDRIKGNGPKVDHSTAGAFLCAKNGQNYATFCSLPSHEGSGLKSCFRRFFHTSPRLAA